MPKPIVESVTPCFARCSMILRMSSCECGPTFASPSVHTITREIVPGLRFDAAISYAVSMPEAIAVEPPGAR